MTEMMQSMTGRLRAAAAGLRVAAAAGLRRLGRGLVATQPGQSMVEYAILAALIAVVAMVAVQALGGGIAQVFQNILGRISGIGT
jgi:Flp pilus assembly pilin Flp